MPPIANESIFPSFSTQRPPDAISVRRSAPGAALTLFPVEAVRRMPFIVPHHQDEDALRSDFKEHVIGELLQV